MWNSLFFWWLSSWLCQIPVYNDPLSTPDPAAWLFHLKAKRRNSPVWSVYLWQFSISWLVFSPSSRWPEATSLWDVLGSCGTGHSHSSGHCCCPGSYSPSKKKKGNSFWVREVLLVLVREIIAFSSSVISDSIIFQKALWLDYFWHFLWITVFHNFMGGPVLETSRKVLYLFFKMRTQRI